VACFKCFNPQAVCPNRGRGTCEFGDIVLPTCWGAYQLDIWRRDELPILARRKFDNEEEYMQWLGEERTVHGVQASNAAYIADKLFPILLGRIAERTSWSGFLYYIIIYLYIRDNKRIKEGCYSEPTSFSSSRRGFLFGIGRRGLFYRLKLDTTTAAIVIAIATTTTTTSHSVVMMKIGRTRTGEKAIPVHSRSI